MYAKTHQQQSNNDEEMAAAATYLDDCSSEYFDEGKLKEKDKSQQLEIGQEETKLVRYSKALVAIVIIAVASTISAITYIYVGETEEKNFKSQFDTIANEIIELSDIRARNLFDSLSSMSTTVTGYALATNATWPFVSIPDFEVQGMVSNKATGASTIALCPIVQPQDREKWENFSLANKGWIRQGLFYQEQVNSKLYHNPPNITQHVPIRGPPVDHLPLEEQEEIKKQAAEDIVPYIHYINWANKSFHYEEPLDFYVPSWQVAPTPAFPYVNVNLRRYSFDKYLVGLIENDQPVLTEVASAGVLDVFHPGFFSKEEIAKPHSYIQQPVYDNFLDNRTIVAALSAFLRWDNFFVNLLPESEQGIVLVLHGSCGDVFTYQLNGFETEYLGEGDLHDVEYDTMEKVFEFASFATLKETEEETFCKYSAKLYPSDEWRDPFFTNNPILYAMIVLCCFFLTTLVFVIYDCMVQKRQKTVMDSATKTNAIVTSLFPSNVRDRLIEEVANAEDESASKGAYLSNSVMQKLGSTSETIFGSKPIADLFPSTTIMFADMVGFTKWSSTREPCQVFTLLETVYHSFDMIAKRMRVFKVETIGDCYVAVSGLPTPRDDHAIVMSKFASRCMERMMIITNDLKESLGADTAELALRIGLHSGPVTAGVLRGDKGRFQLFGDTMNTTSRIETTGTKGRIHLSKDTAQLLIDAGKGSWVVPREDKVTAKGKGELETFWLWYTEGEQTNFSGISINYEERISVNNELQINVNNEQQISVNNEKQISVDNEEQTSVNDEEQFSEEQIKIDNEEQIN